jgi:hypothetical protein
VIQVLRYLEDRINAMIGIWGLDGTMAAEAAEKRAVGGDDALLNGPARPGHGLDQADVDMVMGPAAARAHDAPPLQPADTHEAVEEPEQIVEAEPERPAPRAEVPVIEAEAIEQPDEVIEAPTAAIDVPAEKVEVRTAPRVPDALAPIMALSAEEKIALFT